MSTRHGPTLTVALVLLVVLSGCIGASPSTTDTTTTTTTTAVDTTTTTTTTTASPDSNSVSTDTMTTIAESWENASTIEPGTLHEGEIDSQKFFFEITSPGTIVVTIDDMANNSYVAVTWTQQNDGPEMELLQKPGTYEFDLDTVGGWGFKVESRGEGPLVNVTVTLENQ